MAPGVGPIDKSGLEVELKLKVPDLSSLMRVAMAAGGTLEPTLVQTNEFYDTPSKLLDKQKYVLRLRHEKSLHLERYLVTAKGRSVKNAAGLSTVAEEEIEIDAEQARLIRGGADPLALLEAQSVGNATRTSLMKSLRDAAGTETAVFVGALVNERTPLPTTLYFDDCDIDLTLELDRTVFPGNQVHYEVEVEIPNHIDHALATAAFYSLFAKAQVVGRVVPGKARRFFLAAQGRAIDDL